MVVEALARGIERIEREVNPLTLLTPTNKTEVKRAFLEEGRLLAFSYPDQLDPEPIRSEIEALRPLADRVDPAIAPLAHEMLDDLAARLRLCLLRDTPGIIEASRAVYGPLRPSTVTRAIDLLASTSDPEPPERFVDADHVKRLLEQAIERYGLEGWRVTIEDREITAVMHAQRVIALPARKRFAPEHGERLIVHEVGVHVLRGENGRRQPLKLLASGLPGYMETEEGLAVYTEASLGTLSMFTMRQYALRVIAVECAIEGLSLADACRRFIDGFGLTDSQAFDVAFRAYRGGGYAKDHLYYQGFLDVREYVRTRPIEELYVGKVGVGDRALIEKLRSLGWVRDPELLPEPMPSWNARVENL